MPETNVPAYEILQQQARYWVNRGRGDLAIGALRRVLASDPDNANALYEIGLLMISEGDITSARTFEARLRRQEGAYALATQLRREVDNAEVDRNLLNEARRRAAEGDAEVALGLYEKLFADREIGGALAVEYYETLAGMEDRWGEAADGLRHSYDSQPSNGRVRLAMAKVLSYREETRREALFHFNALLEDAVFRDDALAGMREALLWLSASADDQVYYDRYLGQSQDEAVAEKLALALNPKVVDAFTAARIDAYKALNQGQLRVAEQRFNELLKQRSNDAESLGGLGLVKLRGKQFATAADYLNRAIRADAGTRRNFGQALDEARFWGTHAEVVRHIDEGNLEQARQAVARLQGNNNNQKADVYLLKARIAMETANWQDAERQCREALAIDKENPGAVAALLNVLGTQQRYTELENQLQTFERQAARGAFKDPQARAAMRRAQAQVAAWREDWGTALAAYEQAVRGDPDNVWLRLEYARMLILLDRKREAEALMAGLSRPGSDTDAVHALALYYADMENWDRCLAALETLPASRRSKDVVELAETAQIRHRIELAMQRASMGDRTTAVNEMLALQEYRTTSPYKTMLIADGLIKLGLNDQAGLMVRRDLSNGTTTSVDVLVQYARILGEAGELNSAHKLMTDLMLRRGELNTEQRFQVARVYDDILLRASRSAIDSGQYDLALSYLEPIYRTNPLDGAVLRHLGEVHQRMGNYTTARKFYESAMAVDTSDLWAVKGAVGAALDEEDIEAASRLLDLALNRFPDSPDVYTLISRTAHSANDLDMAIEAAERAKALKREGQLPAIEAPSRYQAPPGERLPPMSPQNPFRVDTYPRNAPQPERPRALAQPARAQLSEPAGKPAWHDGWSLVTVAWQDPNSEPSGAGTSARGSDWDAPESPEALDSLLQAEIESTRQAMATVPANISRSNSTAPIQGLPTHLSFDTIVQLVELLTQQGKPDQVEQIVLGLLSGDTLDSADQARLAELLYPSALQLAEAALDRNESTKAFEHLRPVLGVPGADSDPRFLRTMAGYFRSEGELDRAASMYDRALALTPADETLRVEAVATRLQMDELPIANAIAIAGLEIDPNSARLHFMVGRIAKELGDLDSAMEHFLIAKQAQGGAPQGGAALAASPAAAPANRLSSPQPAMAPATAVPVPQVASAPTLQTEELYGNPWNLPAAGQQNYRGRTIAVAAAESSDLPAPRSQDDIRERLRSLGREGPAGRDAPAAQRESALGNTLDSELDLLRAEASPFFGVGSAFRYRSGEEGLSKLTELRAPLEFDFNPYQGRLMLLVEPIYLTSGDFGEDPNRARRFGTLALVEEEARFAPVDDSVGGVGITFGYSTGDFTVDVGTTPMGFEILNAVGGMNLSHEFKNGFGIGVDVSRRAVTESILSYAGVRDPLTNEEWGAVTNNEITLELTKSFQGFSFYADAWYGVNVGDRVDDNDHHGADFGFTIDLLQAPGRSLRAGFNTTYFSYDENQRFFTLGHGGYFSPQTFISSSIPIDYELSTDRLKLRFSGAIGTQYYSEDSEFYYPNRTDLQIELFEFESEQPVIYDGRSDTDISFRASGEVIYKLTPRIQIRGLIGIDRTADWTETVGLMSFQYRPGL